MSEDPDRTSAAESGSSTDQHEREATERSSAERPPADERAPGAEDDYEQGMPTSVDDR